MRLARYIALAALVSATLAAPVAIAPAFADPIDSGSLAQERWSACTFTNSWVNYDDTTWQPCGYMRDSLGRAHLRGLVKNGTINTAVLTLPARYRPKLGVHCPSVSNAGAGAIFGYVTISAAGVVKQEAGGTTWLSLDSCSFDTR